MAVELKVPSAGESITEVTIVEWMIEVGSTAKVDEALALIETDKANVELLAPVAGKITKILKGAGEVAAVGEVIGYLESSDGASAPEPKKAEAPPPKPAAPAAPAKPAAQTAPDRKPAPDKKPAPQAAPASVPKDERPAATDVEAGPARRVPPSKRRALREGRAEEGSAAPGASSGAAAAPAPSAPPPSAAPAPRAAPSAAGERRVPMTNMRRRIAERLVESQHTAALLTTFNEIDMGEVMALRAAYQERFVARHGVKLGFMSFFVKATVEALKELPAINASIDGDDIVYHDAYDIGVAVGGGRGLVVPVIRDAENLGFAEIEKIIGDYGARAKANKLKMDELQGGTFTISNGGVYGSLMSTPIVNPPQSGILGMHAIQDRPVVKNGGVVVAKMMYVALTYDHRLVDGREAVTFLVRIKDLIENPTRMLLEV